MPRASQALGSENLSTGRNPSAKSVDRRDAPRLAAKGIIEEPK